jgi:hypothetical protein
MISQRDGITVLYTKQLYVLVPIYEHYFIFILPYRCIYIYINMCIGPLLSSVVSFTKYDFTARWNNNIIIQYELVTAPGWIMFGLFLFALILVISNFEEPPINHHGRLEKNEKINETFLNFFMNFFNYFKSFFGSFFEKKEKGVNMRGYGSYGTISVQEEVVRMYVYMLYVICSIYQIYMYVSGYLLCIYMYVYTVIYEHLYIRVYVYICIYMSMSNDAYT